MPDEPSLASLSPRARLLVDSALFRQQEHGHPTLGLSHWLAVIADREGAVAAALVTGLEPASLLGKVAQRLREGAVGMPMSVERAVRDAVDLARARGQDRATERELVAVLLVAAGYPVHDATAPVARPPGSPARPPAPVARPPVPTLRAAPPAAAPGAAAPPARPGAVRRPTPVLEQLGRDLTAEALAGRLPPVVGRDAEIDLVIETLCRRTKRNPALVGPAGVGKTAIVEGLALRIVAGKVPEALRGVRLLAIQASTLVAGARMQGEVEQRVKAVLSEAAQEGVVLFLDEMHSMVGTGGTPGTSDLASQIKPALARGEFALIAATTDDEYRRFIEPDTALERRFQPIRVHELSPEETLVVLRGVLPAYAGARGVTVPDEVLRWIVSFAASAMRNRRFPDKAIDLLDQLVAHALTRGKREVAAADAEEVASRMVGRPPGVDVSVAALRERLQAAAPLPPEDLERLADRVEVTARGLDLRPHRPNLVVLVLGAAATHADALAETLAEALAGSRERVVPIDCSRFVHPEDVTMLVGAAPGYVGYGDLLPLHRVVQTPWCVLLLRGVDAAHPRVREVIAEALASGYFLDGQGRRIWLSDAAVLLTADAERTTAESLGFGRDGETSAAEERDAARDALGPEMAAQVDLVLGRVAESPESRRRWVEGRLLAALTERYAGHGVRLEWDESVVRWILDRAEKEGGTWERVVEDRLGPVLARALRASTAGGERVLRVVAQDGVVRVVEPGAA